MQKSIQYHLPHYKVHNRDHANGNFYYNNGLSVLSEEVFPIKHASQYSELSQYLVTFEKRRLQGPPWNIFYM